jgi:ubiquinone/menaquinone biosynthesis C-methylase UbiE
MYHQLVQRLIPDVDFHQNHYARLLEEELPTGARWLDIGAGTQIHNGYGVPSPKALAARCDEVVGVDLELEHLRQNPELTSYAHGSAESLPFDAGRFTFVTANMVLEHLERPAAVFAEIHRVLAPGGKFVFVTPNKNHPLPRLSAALLPPAVQRQIAHRIEGRPLEHIFPTFYRANTRSAIARLARDAGLQVRNLTVHRNIPFFSRPAAMVWLECQFIRVSRAPLLSGMGADLTGCLTKD